MHWPADQEALCEIAVAASQEFELRQCFDAFGGDLDIETLCHGDRSPDDALMTVVLIDIGNQ